MVNCSGRAELCKLAGHPTHPIRSIHEMEETNLDQFTLKLDDNEELNAEKLMILLNSGVEEALSSLSPEQLMQLERNVQKLKRQKTPSAGPAKSSKGSAGRKRYLAEEELGPADQVDGDYEGSPESCYRKNRNIAAHMNLPASAPQVEFREGIEWLHFSYSTKGVSDYCIRADIEDLSLDDIPEDFKTENCVYPRALVPRETYIGNRWEYETNVNDVAWKLCWKNPEVLCGKRGLIQRAVDSYRNRATESRSRRVMRQDKMTTSGITPRRRSTSHSSSAETVYSSNCSQGGANSRSLSISYTDKDGQPQKIKIFVDVEAVDTAELSPEFKNANCLYPQALDDPDSSFAEGRWEYESACNELGYKLAWLNASKISGRRNLLQKAVDAYQSRIEASERARQSIRRVIGSAATCSTNVLPMGGMMYNHHQPLGSPHDQLDKNEEFSQLVAHTLQQALNQHVQGEDKAGFQL